MDTQEAPGVNSPIGMYCLEFQSAIAPNIHGKFLKIQCEKYFTVTCTFEGSNAEWMNSFLQARQILEREYNNLLALGTERRLDEVNH